MSDWYRAMKALRYIVLTVPWWLELLFQFAVLVMHSDSLHEYQALSIRYSHDIGTRSGRMIDFYSVIGGNIEAALIDDPSLQI